MLNSPSPGRQFFVWVVLAMLATACRSKEASSQAPGSGHSALDAALQNCSSVVTYEKISAFNQTHVDYQITGAGMTATCSLEINDNGRVTRAEAKGFTAITVLPTLRFQSIDKTSDRNSFLLKAESITPNEDELRSIVARLSFKRVFSSEFCSFRQGRSILCQINRYCACRLTEKPNGLVHEDRILTRDRRSG